MDALRLAYDSIQHEFSAETMPGNLRTANDMEVPQFFCYLFFDDQGNGTLDQAFAPTPDPQNAEQRSQHYSE